jgi:hypothetical protein
MRRKMINQRVNDVIKRSAKVGDCIRMELDKRDIPHARALLGVVFKVGRGGGVQVVTSDGVISNEGKVYYLPMTKYTVIKEQSVESVVPAVLKAFRETILSGHFLPGLMKKTSMAAAYRVDYDVTAASHVGCKCKMNCQGYCGCRKKKMACGDKCICRGQCTNSVKLE